jgi:Domain of unknown function (DUF4158)
MSTGRGGGAAERGPDTLWRPTKVVLPVDPTNEELARDWTLSDADKAEVQHCRGDDNRCRFAVQLCVLRKYGRFLGAYQGVPTRILSHLSRQLELPPVLFLADSERSATEYEYQERIRQYLGYQAFDQQIQEQLTRWLEARAIEELLPEDLLHRAESLLRSWHIELPAPSTLERLITSVTAQAQQGISLASPTACRQTSASPSMSYYRSRQGIIARLCFA